MSRNVLIVGCGRVAGSNGPDRDGATLSHAGAYCAAGGFDLAACVDPDTDARMRFMRLWGVPRGFASLDDALAAIEPPALASVCAPTTEHAAALDRLARSPVRAVFCEKPLTASVAESRRLAASFRETGKLLAVNHQRRWARGIVALRDELAAGAWGALRCAVGSYTKGVRNNGSHLIDLASFLLGTPALVALGPRRIDHDAADPTIDAMLGLPGGGVLHMVGADARDYALFDLDLTTERGRIRIHDLGFRIERRRVKESDRFPGYRELDSPEIVSSGLERALVDAVREIAAACDGGPPPASTAETALVAESICEQILAGTDLQPILEQASR